MTTSMSTGKGLTLGMSLELILSHGGLRMLDKAWYLPHKVLILLWSILLFSFTLFNDRKYIVPTFVFCMKYVFSF